MVEAGLRRNVGRLGRGGGVQLLDGLPDPGHGALAVRELLDRLQVAAESGDAGEAVPDLDQAVGGPVGGELGKLLFGGEVLLAFGDLLGGREGRDGVVVVDGETWLAPSRPQARLFRAGAGGALGAAILRRPSMTTGTMMYLPSIPRAQSLKHPATWGL
jgi:hypothetical protein